MPLPGDDLVPSPVLETTHAAPRDVATIVALLVFAVVSFAPLAFFVRGGCRNGARRCRKRAQGCERRRR